MAIANPENVGDVREKLYVVFADMVGYSAHTSRDETGTHNMWMRFVEDIVLPTSKLCHGEVVRTLGDGILLSFSEAEDALDWCLQTQQQVLQDRGGRGNRFPDLSLRCAAHGCDAIKSNGDIYGNGVNVTKRLQEAIAPDGIIVSSTLFHEASQKRDLRNRNLGVLKLKNIDDPIQCYEILPEARPTGVGLGRASQNLPSIAVMPLNGVPDNLEFDFFADGVVDDIITSLISLRELIVIARSSTLSLKSKSLDPFAIGQVLNVRYVLTGKIRKSSDRIRISTTLSDTLNGEIVFSENSDFPHHELFETQDKIVGHIVSKIAPNIRNAERVHALRKVPENFTAYELTLRALDHMSRLDKESYLEAKDCLQKSMALDPDFAMPVAYLVRWYCVYIGQGWSDDFTKDIADARDAATKAIQLDRYNALALASYGHLKSYLERDYETALLFLDRAREVGPSLALAWMLSSATLSYLGRTEEAIAQAKHGIRLSPHDHDLFQFYDFLAIAYYLDRNFEEAVHWCECSFSEKPDYLSNWRVMIMTNAASGRLDRAKEFVSKLLSQRPTFTIDQYLEDVCPFRRPEDRKMVAEHFALAGIQ